MERYVDLLFKWNASVRLTGVRAPSRFRGTLIEDTLAALEIAAPLPWKTAVDIGSGNGLVAVPLAVLHPDRDVTALEPDEKKAVFLQHAASELKLGNLKVVRGRFENWAPMARASDILWAVRAMEIAPGTLLARLCMFPGSHVLLFYAEGGRSSEFVRLSQDITRTVGTCDLSGDGSRRAFVMQIAPPRTSPPGEDL